MKVVILAGGLGTRLAEETEVRPKPMVEIGGRPILWHIMKHFSHHGFHEFVIALGHKGDVIKRYFLDRLTLGSDLTVDLAKGKVKHHAHEMDHWLVHLIDTGAGSNTGGRLARLQSMLEREPFLLTYGDGVGDVDLRALVRAHKEHGKIATITAVRPPARYGGLFFDGPLVSRFTEKPQAGEGWINGGFMVFEPSIFRYVRGDDASLEADVLERLAAERQLGAYRHERFWQCMDTLRDKNRLESLWQDGTAPWRVWS
jgi:glucose-1-phosphate cytidylyltransferase